MNNILAIDTSNEYLSLALSINETITIFQEKVGNKQSLSIIPQIETLLKTANQELNKINLIVYNQGPGSFTGLRIGLSVALGLAYSLNCNLIPLPAFAMYLQKKPSYNQEYLLVLLDARLGQIYVALINYQTHEYIIIPQLIYPDKLVNLLMAYPQINDSNTLIKGSGYHVYADKFGDVFSNYQYLEEEYPVPEFMIDLAQSGHYPECSVYDADLLYIRNKVALDLNEQALNKKS